MEATLCRYCATEVEGPNICDECKEFIAWSRSQTLRAREAEKRRIAQEQSKAYNKKHKKKRNKAKKARKARKKNRR